MTCYYKQDLSTEQMLWFRFMVFNATFNNTFFSFIMAVTLLVKETRAPQKKVTVTDKLYRMMYRVHLVMSGIRTWVVIDTDCTGSCKSQPRQHLKPMSFSLILLPNELKLTYVTSFDVSLSILQISAENMQIWLILNKN